VALKLIYNGAGSDRLPVLMVEAVQDTCGTAFKVVLANAGFRAEKLF
jgi:hypothetical protein